MTLSPALQAIRRMKGPLVGMQMGVFDGALSEEIIKEIPHLKTFYLVDPFEAYDKHVAYRNPAMQQTKEKAHARLSKYGDIIIWIKKYIDNSIANDLSFVYLDGSRTYDFIYRDILAAIQSVKKGGIVAGCEYGSSTVTNRWLTNNEKNEVKRAVDDFCTKNKIIINIEGTSWWFENPYDHEQTLLIEGPPQYLRPSFEFIKEAFKKKSIQGMEVGVEYGENADIILSQIKNIKTLYLVDPYEIYPDYWDYQPFGEGMKTIEEEAHKRLEKHKDRIIWIKGFFKNGMATELDFIYIDGNHRYHAVMEDIVNGIKSVKKGGVIAGHDYDINEASQQVKKAVDDFCAEHKIELHTKEIYSSRFNRMIGDWWFVNPYSEKEAKALPMPSPKKCKSYGLYDTVVGRKCGTFEQLLNRLEVKHGIKDFVRKRINAEVEVASKGSPYVLEDVYRQFLAKEGINDEARVKILASLEYGEEYSNAFLIMPIYNTLESSDIIINDTFYNFDQINQLLVHAGFNKNVTIYSLHNGKGSGNLWGTITTGLDLVSHTGSDDNLDISFPKSLGINTIKVDTGLNADEKRIAEISPERAWDMRYKRLFSGTEIKPIIYSKLLKICAVSAVYNDDTCLPTFFQKLDQLTHKIDYHIFVTNNCTDQTDPMIDEYLKTHPGKRISYNMHPDFVAKIKDPYAPAAVAWQRGLREARKMFEADPTWSHVLYLDSDVFINTPDAIERAAAREKSIVAGPYLRDFPNGRHLAGIFKIDEALLKILPQYRINQGEYMYFDQIFFDLIQVPFTSNGFCLYNRDVVMDKRINFWPIFRNGPDCQIHDECSPEFGYQNAAYFRGYYTWLDGSISLGHYLGYRHRPHRGDGKTYVAFKYLK